MTQGKEMNDLIRQFSSLQAMQKRHCDRLKAANAELLAALEELVAACTIPDEDEPETMTQARAAIAKAKEE
tara:strand:- start:161 stop:373 length:213 start_codon:yes stop_codon:yes gene_type:complete